MSSSNNTQSSPGNDYNESQRSSDNISCITSSQATTTCPFSNDRNAVADCYFSLGDEQKNENGVGFKIGTCLCGAQVKYFVGKGPENLYSHVIKAHRSEYVDQVQEYKRQQKNRIETHIH